MTKPQIITSPSGEELVVLPRSEYEDLVDALAARKVEAALAAGREELLGAQEVSHGPDAARLLAQETRQDASAARRRDRRVAEFPF